MHYISTRGQAQTKNFLEVVTSGLASDGGLYVPESWPQFSAGEIKSWEGLSYVELAEKIITPFVDGEIPQNELREIINKSYRTFRHADIAPLVELEKDHHILELFHGPTLAFKDFALQFLGNLLDYTLSKQDKDVVIIGATSGDTGSAAIAGCIGCKHIELFMLFPNKRVSEVQRRQMTTILSDNIHNLAVGSPEAGNFDDCQDMVKHMFQHPDFMDGKDLVAVNSINWARIMAQIVYYFYSALKLGAPDKEIAFSVPTGNFGDIFAGYVAHKMGLPIKRLIVATNQNDILDRFFKSNDYRKEKVNPSTSPSMDIQISSNFERLLFDLYGQDSEAIKNLMDGFKQDGEMKADSKILADAKNLFTSHATDDSATKKIIKDIYDEFEYTLDPHTATGVGAAREYKQDYIPMVTLATAHPAKFPDVVEESINQSPALPEHLADLFEREERFTPVENNLEKVQEFIKNTAG